MAGHIITQSGPAGFIIQPGAASSGLSNNSTRRAPRILSLESDGFILELYGLILRKLDCEFLGTCDEHEALHLLLTQPVDLFIQNLAGRAWLLRLMKSEMLLPEIPVLLSSAYTKNWAIDMLKEAGLVLYRDLAGYLEKPCSPLDLLAFV